MKRIFTFPLRNRDLWLICLAYAVYLLILNLNPAVDPIVQYGFSRSLHFVLVLGFLLFLDGRNRLFSHDYCRVRFKNRKQLCQARLRSLLMETAIFWLPHCVLMVYAGIVCQRTFGMVIAGPAVWLIELFALSLFVSALDTTLSRKYSVMIIGLILTLDVLQAGGSLIPLDFSMFYGPGLQLFQAGEMTARVSANLALATAELLLGIWLQRRPARRSGIRIIPWIRTSLRKTWIGFPIGVLVGLWGTQYRPESQEKLWLFTLGMISTEELSGFLLILVHTIPFIVSCFLFGLSQSKEQMTESILTVTREGTRKAWWRRKQLTLLLAAAGFAALLFGGITVTGLLFGIRFAGWHEARSVLAGLISTRFAVEYAMLSGAVLLCLFLDERLVFLLVSGLHIAAQILAFLPRTVFVTGLLRIILPCRAAFLLHECPNALQDCSALFYRGINGLQPGMTLLFAGITTIIVFLAGIAVADRADFV